MVKTFLCYLFLAACVSVVLLQGLHPAWSGHLITDLFVFKERSVGNFVNNEYQPGALFFFSLLSPFAIDQTLDTFKTALFSANILLVFLIAFIIHKISKPENNIILGLIIFLTGPILLFRFELLVVSLVLACFYYFKKGMYSISSILLALAVTVKIYPLIYLPYLFLSLYKHKNIKESVKFSLFFIVTFGGFLFLFIHLYNFSFSQLIDSVRYHALKPIGVEGFWSAIISIVHIFSTGSPPSLVAEYVTWGISHQDQILPMWFFNNLWVLVLGLLYFFHFYKDANKKINEIFLITLTLATIIFSKLSSPQYLIWFIFLLPLVDFEKFVRNTRYSLILIGSLFTAFLSQYIYPLNYTEFLSFFNNSRPVYIFYIFIFKNLLLLTVFYLSLTLIDE